MLRAVGAAGYGGADIAECLATAARVDEGHLPSWYEQWSATAAMVTDLAESERQAGHRESARLAYLRARTYHRTAGVMLLGVPLDQRLVSAYAAQTTAFRQALALMDVPGEVIEIPFEDGVLPRYFYRPAAEDRCRATVILTGGCDGTCEESCTSPMA